VIKAVFGWIGAVLGPLALACYGETDVKEDEMFCASGSVKNKDCPVHLLPRLFTCHSFILSCFSGFDLC